MWAPLVARREPGGSRTGRQVNYMFLNIKSNIFLSMLQPPTEWQFNISVIYPQ